MEVEEKKGGEYSSLAKQTIIKQAKKYPKRYDSKFESKSPGEILKKKTHKVYYNKYPHSKGGKRKTKKRKFRK